MSKTTSFRTCEGRHRRWGQTRTCALVAALALTSLALESVAAQPTTLEPDPYEPSEPGQAPPPAVPGKPEPGESLTRRAAPPVQVPEEAFPAAGRVPQPAQVPGEAFPPPLQQPTRPLDMSAAPPPSAAASASAADASREPDGGVPFSITSGNGAYKLRIGLQSGLKAEAIVRDGDLQDRSPFFVIRPILSGHLVEPWIKFWFSMELASNPPYLLDAYVDLNPVDAFALRVGQQYTPFSRHESFGPQQLLFPEFSPVANYFWSGRDKGATVFGNLLEKRLNYYAGFYGGSPLRQFTILDGNYVVEGRVTWNPLGPTGDTEYPYIVHQGEGPAPFRPSFTLNGYYGKIRSAVENFNPSSFSFVPAATDTTTKSGTVGADVLLQGRRFVFFVEGYYRRTRASGGFDAFNTWGAWGQLGVLLVERHLDVAVRGSWINPSNHLLNDRFLAIEGQFAYYLLAPYVVFKLRYGYGVQRTPDMAAQGPVVLPIATGKLHIVTLQLNLSF